MANTRIMVVEDEGIIAQDIKQCLENLGYEVPEVVFTGSEAIKKAEIARPDLILMDIVLKGEIDGIETASEIRKRYNIPIVYLTAYEDDKTLNRAKLTQPLGYILKPFEERYLKSSIEMALYKHEVENKLRENEEWLKTILDSVGDAVIVTDEKGLVKFMNPMAENITGWKESEAMGKDSRIVINVMNEDAMKEIENPVYRVLRDKMILGRSNHIVLISKQGKEIAIDHSASPMHDINGNISGVVLIIHDISQRRSAEIALKESESKYRNLFDYANDAIFVLSKDGKIISVNNEACRLLDESKQSLINQTFSELIKSKDNNFAEAAKIISEKGSFNFECSVEIKNGNVTDVEVSMRSIRFADEDVIQVIMKNVTLIKQSQKEINLLATAIKSITECICITNLDNKLIYVNEAFEHLYGYSREELLGKSLNIIRSQNNSPELYDEIYNKTLSGGWQGELINRSRDGREFPILLSTSIIRNADDKPVAHMGVATDISERKNLESALRESEKDYKELFENAYDAIVIFRPSDNLIFDVNNSAVVNYGYSKTEFLGMGLDLLVVDYAKFTDKVNECLEKNVNLGFESLHRKKDGTEMIHEVNITPVKHKGQTAIVSINRDVTERRKALLSLELSEKRYQDLYDGAPDMYFSVTPDGYVKSVNKFGAEYLGYTKNELVGNEVWIVVHKDDVENVKLKIKNIFSTRNISEILEFRKVKKDGSVIWVNETTRLIYDDIGNPSELFIICRDITHKKLAEQKREESDKRYRNLAENAPIAVSRINLATYKYEYVNEEFIRQCGFTMKEYNSLPQDELKALAYPDDKSKVTGFLKRWKESGYEGTHQIEYRVYRKDKSLMCLDTYIYADFDENGKAIAMNQLCIDITERKRISETIKESQLKYKNLATYSPMGITRWNSVTQKYDFANDKFTEITGYTFEELQNMTNEESEQLVPPDDLVKFNTMSKDWVEGNYQGAHHAERRVKHKSGNWIWVEGYTYADFDSTGKPIGINKIFMEVTQRKKIKSEISESEKKYKNLAENAPIAVTRYLLQEGKYDFVNDEFVRQSGYNKSEYNSFNSEQIINMLYAEDRELVVNTIGTWKNEGYKGTLQIQYRIINRYKNLLWLDTFLYVEFDEQGTPVAINQICIDITEQTKAKEKLQKSEERYRLIADNSLDLIGIVNTEGVLSYVSPSHFNVLGYSHEELINSNILELVKDEEKENVVNILDELITSGKDRKLEITLKHKNESWVYTEIILRLIPSENDNYKRILISGRNISERKKAEVETLLQKSYFQQLFESSPEAIVMLDNKDCVVNVNKGFERLFQFSLPEIKGKKLNSFIVPESLYENASQLSSFILKGETINRETVRKRKDGSLVDVSILGYSITLEGDQIGVYGIYSDITDRKETEKALRTSEDRYKAFVRHSTEGIWRFEMLEPISVKATVNDQVNAIFKYAFLAECNDIVARMYGYNSSSEISGARLKDMLLEDDLKNVEYIRNFVLSSYKVEDAESHEIDKSGGQKYFLKSLVGIVENDYLIRAWGTQKDITEKKIIEEKNKKNEEYLRIINYMSASLLKQNTVNEILWDVTKNCVESLGLVDMVIYLTDETGTKLIPKAAHGTKNPIGKEIKNPIELLVGRGIVGSIAVSGKPEIVNDTSADSRYIVDQEMRLSEITVPILSDGRVIGIIDSEHPQKNFFNQEHLNILVTIASLCSNKIKRALAEETLRSTELRLATLLTSLPDVVLYETGSGKEFISENVKDLLGYPSPKFIEDRTFFTTLIHPSDKVILDDKVRKWQRAGRPGIYNAEFRCRKSDGTYIWLEDHMIGLKDTAETATMAGVLIDITEHKSSETQLRQLAEKLSSSNKELEQFAYVASHDLQEPLRMVSSYTQLLQRRYKGQLDKEADDFINYAVDGVQRMKSLINDLLAYSRVNTQEKLENIDSNSLIKQVMTNMQTTIDETKTNIIFDNLPVIQANPLLMNQLFQNLLSNAIKFRGDRTPVINITAKQTDNEWLFTFKDNGIGIEKDYLEKIFVIFQRLHNVSEYPGTGIGLAICKKIIEKLGGHIWVESEPGNGSTFNFTIPIKEISV